MTRRCVLAAAVLAVLGTTTPALAATRPRPRPAVCNLIKDPIGDAGISGQSQPQLYDPSLDIVSADIGVNAAMLTAVIRVRDLTQDSPLYKAGRRWNITMANGTETLSLAAFASPLGGQRFSSGKGVFDWNADQIRIHAALADYPNAKIKKGVVLRGFYVTANQVVGLDPAWSFGYASAPFSTPADRTDATTAAFTVGNASCVTVGK